ncbi:MAG TPA: hypothetical protein VIX58_08670 [Anaerolineae bacterium]
MSDKTILLLGGAGLVGTQIARQLARDVRPQKVVIASLYSDEVNDALKLVRKEYPEIEWVGITGDVFVREAFSTKKRGELLRSHKSRDELNEDLFGDFEETFQRSRLVQLILEYKPNVIVDSINTATAISYQDSYTASIVAKKRMGALLARLEMLPAQINLVVPHTEPANGGSDGSAILVQASAREQLEHLREQVHEAIAELKKLRAPAEQAFDTLVLSQAVPQLIRHVVLIMRAMEKVNTRLYLKIGTTGTGGMGLNIPYTHGEDKPSSRLMSKTAVAFAHTGLLFLMARTPNAPIVKEIKPAAMIGYADISCRAIRERGEPVYRFQPRVEKLGDQLVLRDDEKQYQNLGRLRMVIVDTGENGMFTRGEFEAITAHGQMEFISPEEIAHKVVLEIQGSNTGSDVIAAIDGAVLDPTYRAGILRKRALDEMEHLEGETGLPSIALGQLGPPELSKLLFESFLLRERYRTLDTVLKQRPRKIADALWHYLQKHKDLQELIVSAGLPILAPDGETILRGPAIRIPEVAGANSVPLSVENVDAWARKGWVDLRAENFVRWRDRFERMERMRELIRGRGSAAVTMEAYLHEDIRIGEVVAWVMNNEAGGFRIK